MPPDAEIRAMLIDGGFPPSMVTPEYVAYLRGEIEQTRLAVEERLYNQIRAGLTGPANEQALAAARNLAAREAATQAVGLVRAQLNAMGKVIADGIEAGMHPTKVAQWLDMVKGLDSGRAATLNRYMQYLDNIDPALSADEWNRRYEAKYQKLLRDRKETIAQTEMRYATGEGESLKAESRGANWKCWQTVRDGRVSDLCAGNQAQGWIPIKQAFPSGHMQVPGHPNCRCTIAYRRAAPDDAARARVQARVDATEAAKQQKEEREATQAAAQKKAQEKREEAIKKATDVANKADEKRKRELDKAKQDAQQAKDKLARLKEKTERTREATRRVEAALDREREATRKAEEATQRAQRAMDRLYKSESPEKHIAAAESELKKAQQAMRDAEEERRKAREEIARIKSEMAAA